MKCIDCEVYKKGDFYKIDRKGYKKLENKIKLYEKTLKFYADKKNYKTITKGHGITFIADSYIIRDENGRMARKALKGYS